jgi:hypothetical protein
MSVRRLPNPLIEIQELAVVGRFQSTLLHNFPANKQIQFMIGTFGNILIKPTSLNIIPRGWYHNICSPYHIPCSPLEANLSMVYVDPPPSPLDSCHQLTAFPVLSKAEREHSLHRMDIDVMKNFEVDQDGNAIKDTRMLSMRDIRDVLTDWKKLLTVVFNILATLPVSAFGTFLPLVVKGMQHINFLGFL